MASPVPVVEEAPSDAELISAVRAGDSEAYGDLFARHVAAARRLARQLVAAGDVDDLVSEAFAKVLVVLQRGGGPDLAFRAYLLTAVRRLHVDRIRATSRLHPTDDLTPFDPGVPFRDTAVEGFESGAAARAFASLPERWQVVLWHTEVEQQKPAEVATLLGITPNSVSALAYRAREGLRQAYLSMHAADAEDDACTRTRGELGAYVRGGLSKRDAARVEAHLSECRACAALYLELTEVNSRLGAVIAPLLLGGAAAAYLAGAAHAAAAGAAGGLLGTAAGLLDRTKDALLGHLPVAAAGGLAAAVAAGGLLLAVSQQDDRPAADDGPAVARTPGAAHPGRPGGPDAHGRHGRGQHAAGGRAGAGTPQHTDPTARRAAAGVPVSATTPGAAPGPGSSAAGSPGPSGPSGAPGAPNPPHPAPADPPHQPPTPPLIGADVHAGADRSGVAVGVHAAVGGTDLPPVDVKVPLGAPGAGGPAGGLPRGHLG